MNGAASAFRLLDQRVGWDTRPGDGLAGMVVDGGALRLAPAPRDLGTSAAPALPALARSADGSWWLGGRWGLLRLGACDNTFRAWQEPRRVRAVAARGRRVAVVLGSGLVEVFGTGSGQLLARTRVAHAARVEVGARGDLVVLDEYGRRTELDPSGLVCRAESCRPGDPVPAAPPPEPPIPPGAQVGPAGFCLEGRGCFDLHGRPVPDLAPGGSADALLRRGQYLSLPLDSGIPGCRWHRVRLDADIPDGTAVEIAFATTDGPVEDRAPPAPGSGDGTGFPPGDPHPLDWYLVPSGTTDATLSVPPGRFGYMRLRLTGDGTHTPAVFQVRLDFPRATGMGHLPAVYADDPGAAEFTERFVSIFDAALEEIDEVLARRPALLDPEALPDDALGWLAGLLGTGFEAEMDVARRRDLLRAAPRLFRLRGTVAGLVETLDVGLGMTATVEELGAARPWGAVGTAHLGGFRLFGRSRVRVRLGTSRLGSSRLESGGNPDHDAVLFGAFRIRVHVPAGADTALVDRVVRSQLPAHVVAEVSASSAGFVATVLRVGVDTVLRPPGASVVGAVALGRGGLVATGRAGTAERVLGRPGAFAAGRN